MKLQRCYLMMVGRRRRRRRAWRSDYITDQFHNAVSSLKTWYLVCWSRNSLLIWNLIFFFLLQPLSLAFCIHYASSYQKVEIYCSVNCSFLLLLLCLYNSLCRVLAFSTNSFHLLLSWTRVPQFGTFDLCIFFLTSSSQHIVGLPVGLLEKGFQEYIALTILSSCILSMWPKGIPVFVH